MKKILVTGGSGFIGTNLIIKLLSKKNNFVYNFDKISKYSSKFEHSSKKYQFYKIDLLNKKKLTETILTIKPDYIFHLAAESHVDRSITNPGFFMKNNITATINLLEAFTKLVKKNKSTLHCISTDEVYGELKLRDRPFTEKSSILPNSPYSVSKASADLLCKAWSRTYGIPILITNCSNNFGPFQYPEKLIPFNILNAISKKNILIYGNGSNIRDWIYVDDHIEILIKIMNKKMKFNQYNIGGEFEITNLNLMYLLANKLNEFKSKYKFQKILDKEFDYSKLIKFINDRPGHDFRYAISNNLINKEISVDSILTKNSFEKKLELTIDWFLQKYLKR